MTNRKIDKTGEYWGAAPILSPEQVIEWLEGHRAWMFEVWSKNPELRKQYEENQKRLDDRKHDLERTKYKTIIVCFVITTIGGLIGWIAKLCFEYWKFLKLLPPS